MELIKDLSLPMHGKISNIKWSFLSPNTCPNCHHAIAPKEDLFKNYYHEGTNYGYSVFICSNCQQPYLIWYDLSFTVNSLGYSTHSSLTAKTLSVSPQSFAAKEFPENINEISPQFTKIYNEALAAENMNLHEIAGIGYRKALEFLVKDYLIHKLPEESEVIKKMLLGNCIENKVTNDNIKQMAKRCAWLGNDQTHYEQKFNDMDISDLKKLLEVTVYWIEMELTTEKFLRLEPRK